MGLSTQARRESCQIALLQIVIFVLMCLALYLVVTHPPSPAFIYDETLTLSLDAAAAVSSQQTYSGWVYLRISGSGQLGADRAADAFCVYEAGGGALDPGIGLVVNGFPLNEAGSRVRFLPDQCQPETHAYLVSYDMGAVSAPLVVSTVGAATVDSGGAFTIAIAVQAPPELNGG